jgi:DUF1365 family protein
MHSAIYSGRLSHRRREPVTHAFRYGVTLLWLDLAELGQVFRGRWLWSARRPALAWFRRADYHGDADTPLDVAVRQLVDRETAHYLADTRVEAIVAEITNTPWNERHAYVLLPERDRAARATMRFRLGKSFHVSPFMPMEIDYDWRFSAPGETLAVHMTNLQRGRPVFDATLTLRRRRLTAPSMAGVLMRQPAASLAVVSRIYWQALRLWAKRVPFHVHPAKRTTERTA